MPLLYIARHGETTWNREGRYQGQRESDLSDLGRRQARALASALGGIPVARVVSSPLRRCRETANAVARAAQLPLHIDPRVIEIAHGTWEGRLRSDIERDDRETYAAWREHPERVRFVGGESLDEVDARWRAFQRHVAALDGDSIVVTHDVVVRLAILSATGRGLDALWEPCVANGGYARIRLDASDASLEEECCDGHLEGLRTNAEKQAL